VSQSYLVAKRRAEAAIIELQSDADTVAMLEGDDSYIRAKLAGAEVVQGIYRAVFEGEPEPPAGGEA
jgi:hypothetical protein